MSGTLSLKKPSGATDLRSLMRDCAKQLDAAAALRIGHMDSDSRVAEINSQRNAIIASVAAVLRGASQA